MAVLPLREREMVGSLTSEFANLKLRLTSQRDRVPADSLELLNSTIRCVELALLVGLVGCFTLSGRLLSSLASGMLSTSQATVRSVRNPHRKVGAVRPRVGCN